MAPSDGLLASQLLTSHESSSAYKLQKQVEIDKNAPIMYRDINNNNEAIIDYNKLLSITDIDLPKSIILYSSKNDNLKAIKYKNNDDNDNNDEDDDDIFTESFWHKEFEKKTLLNKQTLLQNTKHNDKYTNLKFEYDKYHKLIPNENDDNKEDDNKEKKNNGKQPLLEKLINNQSHEIRVKSDNKFKNVVETLKQTNPTLFIDYNTKKGSNDDKNINYKHQLRIENMISLTGYNETNEIELLAVNPENIPSNDINLDVSRLLERNQCDWQNQIIIDDDFYGDANYNLQYNRNKSNKHTENKQNDDDISMNELDIKQANIKEIEMKPKSYLN